MALAIALVLLIFASKGESAPLVPEGTRLQSRAKSSRSAGIEIQRASSTATVYLGKRNGYEVALSMPSDRVVVLYVGSFNQTDESLTSVTSRYVVHVKGTLARGGVRARFGSLGGLSLRFRPNGRVREHHMQRGCKGRPPVTEYGTFVGHVSFDGEGDYLHASFGRGRGEVDRSFRLRCSKGRALDLDPKSLREYATPTFSFLFSPGEGTLALLYAVAREHGRNIGIRAAHQEGSPAGAEVQAGTLESRGRMAIGRSAYVEGFPGTLLTSLPGVHPATATLAPPAPFFGEAGYLEESATSHGWSGTLGVDFPGLTLPLTGPGFYTSLCVVSPLKVPDGCDFIKPKPLRPDRRPGHSRWMFR